MRAVDRMVKEGEEKEETWQQNTLHFSSNC